LRLLADTRRWSSGHRVEKVSHERRCVIRHSKKHPQASPDLKQWVIPPEHNAQFVWRIEEILETSTTRRSPTIRTESSSVCFDDERPCASCFGRGALSRLPPSWRQATASCRLLREYVSGGLWPKRAPGAFEPPLKGPREEMRVTEQQRRKTQFADT
jgi:hypothetical protein